MNGDNSSGEGLSKIKVEDILSSAESPESVFKEIQELSFDLPLRLQDPQGNLKPRILAGILNHPALDDGDITGIEIDSAVEWLPDEPVSFDELFENKIIETLEDLLPKIANYNDEDAQDRVRELMRVCDDLMEDMSAVPESVEELDAKLWDWFQDPPSPEQLVGSMDTILMEVFEGLIDMSDETSSNEDTSATTSSQDSSSGENDREKDLSEEQSSNDDDFLETELDADSSIVSDFLKEANEHLQQLDNLLVEAESDPSEETLGELFRSMHTLKGGFGFCGLDTCTDITHAAENLLDELKQDQPDEIPSSWMDLFFDTMDTVRVICQELENAVEEEADRLTIPLSPSYLDALENDLRKACDGETGDDSFVSREMKNKDAEGQEAVVEDEELGEETVNIELSKIGEIVDLIGELVISHSEIQEQLNGDLSRKLENSLNQQEKILDQLQKRSMNLRMLPLKKEFDKFPRIVRDLSRELDKDIELNVSGADTEIDKSVLDSLHGPLVHLVRNACDHGIETPEEREAAGKPATGTIELRAYHESGNVYIEIEDDGAGLDRDALEEKALDRGIIEENHDLDPGEIDELIFHQGFSTTDEVTDVSGRGVGMDVVASEIENLRGQIAIDSTPGEGTKITIELPLTVAIIDGLIARVGNEQMIFPVTQVVESVNPDPEDIQFVQEKGKVIQVREQVIPLIEPGDFLEGITQTKSSDERKIYVIVRSQNGQFAVYVDELVSHEQVVIKSLEGYELESHNLVSGGAILGDGSVGLILDVPGLVREFRTKQVEAV